MDGKIEEMDYLITDELPEQEYLDYLQEHQVELLLTGEE